MHADRIAELLQPFFSRPTPACHSDGGQGESEGKGKEPAYLSPTQLQDISTYIDILLRWNARINLTAICNEEEIVTRHFGESFFVAQHLFREAGPREQHNVVRSNDIEMESSGTDAASVANEQPSSRGGSRVFVADLGAGAGFPGLPIKLWAPAIALTLIESNHKKAVFLREVVRALRLNDVAVENARAESIPRVFDVVVLRAVEHFSDALATASSLVGADGRLALLISSSQLAAARAGVTQLSWNSPLPIPQSKSRVLLVGYSPTRSSILSSEPRM